jgi:hypothetical protein
VDTLKAKQTVNRLVGLSTTLLSTFWLSLLCVAVVLFAGAQVNDHTRAAGITYAPKKHTRSTSAPAKTAASNTAPSNTSPAHKVQTQQPSPVPYQGQYQGQYQSPYPQAPNQGQFSNQPQQQAPVQGYYPPPYSPQQPYPQPYAPQYPVPPQYQYQYQYQLPPSGGVPAGGYYNGQPNGQPNVMPPPYGWQSPPPPQQQPQPYGPYPLQNPGQYPVLNPPHNQQVQQPTYAPAAQVPNSVQLPPTPTSETVLLILDASFSMSERLEGGESKMAIAKRVILDTLRQIPPSTYVGFRIYGYSSNPITSCSASKLVVPFARNNRAAIAQALIPLRPTGETPISFSLTQAIEQELALRPGKKTIVLVTDGVETCDADPCRVAVHLVKNGSNVQINTVALGLARDYDALRQLKCISAATYGKFYTANTAAELARGLTESLRTTTNVNAQILPKFKP